MTVLVSPVALCRRKSSERREGLELSLCSLGEGSGKHSKGSSGDGCGGTNSKGIDVSVCPVTVGTVAGRAVISIRTLYTAL